MTEVQNTDGMNCHQSLYLQGVWGVGTGHAAITIFDKTQTWSSYYCIRVISFSGCVIRSDSKQHSDVSCVKAQYWPTGKQQQISLLVLTANDRNHQDAIAVYVLSAERFKTFITVQILVQILLIILFQNEITATFDRIQRTRDLRVRPKLRPLPIP